MSFHAHSRKIRIFLLLIVLWMFVACQPVTLSSENQTELPTKPETQISPEAPAEQPNEGILLISITDKALSLGNITSVKLKVLGASAYHKEKSFWSTVSDADVVIDLLELKKKSIEHVYGNKSFLEGDYSMLKLKIADVKVTRNNKEEDAFLPSGELKIQMPFKIEAEKQTKILVDFVADESLHITGDGRIIFAPVLHVKSGKQELSVGMNEKGELES